MATLIPASRRTTGDERPYRRFIRHEPMESALIETEAQNGANNNAPSGAGGGGSHSDRAAPWGGASREDVAARWVAEHADALWRFALARTRSRDIAEEIVQETFLAAMAGFDAYSGASSERTWLLGIAAHKVADHFRRARRASGQAKEGESDDAACGCAACRGMFRADGCWARPGGSWEKADIEREEALEALRSCIDALPPGQGQAVWLRDVLAMPASEVCKAMGVSATNLWSRMHRARLALRSCIEDKLGKGKQA